MEFAAQSGPGGFLFHGRRRLAVARVLQTLLVIALATLGAAGCEQDPAQSGGNAASNRSATTLGNTQDDATPPAGARAAAARGNSSESSSSRVTSPLRIVSLSPAISDILIDLELDAHIVGRDRWESQLPARIPRVGDLTNFDHEALIALAPTDVMIQAGRRGAPAGLEALADDLAFRVLNLQIDGLDDIADAIRTLAAHVAAHGPAPAAPTPAGPDAIAERAEVLIDRINTALRPFEAEVSEPGSALATRPLLLLHALEPPQAFGPGSYLSDVLTRLGGRNALQQGGPWQQIDFETVVALDPWAIVLVTPSTQVDWTPMLRLGLDAADAERLVVLAHPQALIPGSSVAEVADELRGLLADLLRAEASP